MKVLVEAAVAMMETVTVAETNLLVAAENIFSSFNRLDVCSYSSLRYTYRCLSCICVKLLKVHT